MVFCSFSLKSRGGGRKALVLLTNESLFSSCLHPLSVLQGREGESISQIPPHPGLVTSCISLPSGTEVDFTLGFYALAQAPAPVPKEAFPSASLFGLVLSLCGQFEFRAHSKLSVAFVVIAKVCAVVLAAPGRILQH